MTPTPSTATSASPQALRESCARQLVDAAPRIPFLTAFAGLDGFVDQIIHVVDKREDAERFQRLPTIRGFAERAAAAAGRSTNFELVPQKIKLGGNGPILANALATFGMQVTYLGALGWPAIHPVFKPFTERAKVHSLAQPGETDALEFDDGKLILGKCDQLREVSWENIASRFGRDRFAHEFASSSLVAFVNWTMLPCMSSIWESVQHELCPALHGPRRRLFVDLADPEKRHPKDILHALDLITKFEQHFDVTLGLNEKEAGELGKVLGISTRPGGVEGLADVSRAILAHVPIHTLVIHPVSFAMSVSREGVDVVDGPFVARPLITTGAGDHFNAGFCLGQLLGFSRQQALLTGVTTSGHYVRTAQSPTPRDLITMWRDWPGSGSLS